ncbi:MAG TPA: hypothetical protein PK559_04395 [Ignavibacteriaceae bacterium]|nr:hypothetical protein [Ignavibacteriaceae bacterium]
METVENKHQELMLMLDNVSNLLELLNFDNFEELFPKILGEMEQVNNTKSDLIDMFGLDELMQFEAEAFLKAKDIEEKYRIVVQKFSQEDEFLKKEIASSMNKKKLSVYGR